MSDWLPYGVGKLAGTMLGIAIAQRADAHRFARGRTYQRQGAVDRLVVTPGRIEATVQGSRADAYLVEISVPPLTPASAARAAAQPTSSAQHFSALVPDAAELRCSCSCPDWDDPCKHAVAVLVELGERVSADPRLLERWRAETGSAGDDASDHPAPSLTGGRAQDPPHADQPVPDPGLLRQLEPFYRSPAPLPPPPAITALAPPAARWARPWSDVLIDALRALTKHDGTKHDGPEHDGPV